MIIPVVVLECALSLALHQSVPSAAKQKDLINILFDEKEVSQIRLSTIFLLGVAKFILTALCCSLPLPSGLFTPVFTIGALTGRLFGQGVTTISAAYFNNAISFSAGEFAVAGAAAFAGGVTRSIATAAIVMELTGQLHLQIPVAICVLASYFVSNRFAPAVYDVLVKEHRLPHLPKLPFTAVEVSVADAMTPADPSLCATREMDITALRALVQRTALMGAHAMVPVVAGAGAGDAAPMQLDGEMQRRHLAEALREIDATVDALERLGGSAALAGALSGLGGKQRRRVSSSYGSVFNEDGVGGMGNDALLEGGGGHGRATPMVLLRRPSFSLVVLEERGAARVAEGDGDGDAAASATAATTAALSAALQPAADAQRRTSLEALVRVAVSFEDESAKHRAAAASVLDSVEPRGSPTSQRSRAPTESGALCFKLQLGTGAPMQLVTRSSLVQAELLFRMLRMRRCYIVTPNGALVGTLSRDDFVRVADKLHEKKHS